MHFRASLSIFAAFAGVLDSVAAGVLPNINSRHTEVLEKRDSTTGTIPFRPATDWTTDNLREYTKWFKSTCAKTSGNYYNGIEFKTTITYSKKGSTLYRDDYWWNNRRSYTNYPGRGSCELFSRGRLNQCSNGTLGEEQYSDYHGTSYQTYYDCHLKKNVQLLDHPEMGREVVYWRDSSDQWHNYRFYDAHDFAWFISCPYVPSDTGNSTNTNGTDTGDTDTGGSTNGTEIESETRRLGRRQGGRMFPTKNPKWDFQARAYRRPEADATPLDKYITPKDKPLSNWVAGATWWKNSRPDTYWLNGVECEQMAVSRPGLLHYTAIFYY